MRAKRLKMFFVACSCCVLMLCLFAAMYIGVSYATAPVKFDISKISSSKLSINIFDEEKRPLEHTFINGDYISISLLPKYTLDSFISIEDKTFYSHNGLNYKRILAATVKNLLSFSFKEGASTLSQQLIKNTHLSSDKTIKRKINEIKLTKDLEKKLSKDEILEYYLNIIYFGDNCYGIQNASKHYFSHSATKLTLDESAMLAGLIKSPNRYHPVKKYDSAINRRNLVLSEMKRDGKISNKEYMNALNTKTDIVLSEPTQMCDYTNEAIIEASKILNIPEKQIAIGGYRIYTYMNKNKQESLEKAIPSDLTEDSEMICINSRNGHIEAYAQKSNMNLYNIKRQPASAIKPSLVYAPAINENIISPSTIILDDEISINGYEPQNIGGKYNGYINTTYALSNSLNVPAVKILSYVGIDCAKGYLMAQNIKFDKNDNNLALALGGMTYGMTLKELTSTYQTLANGGEFINPTFIEYITDNNGRIIYKNFEHKKRVLRDDTAFLVTSMLRQASLNGTAKRLSDLDFYVASKTGTSSALGSNIDTYNISYTTEDVIGCWIGNLDKTPTDIVGGGKPTTCVKQFLNEIYASKKPKKFTMPSSVVEVEIDEIALRDDHLVAKANAYIPERYKSKALFSRFNMPKELAFNHLTINPVTIEKTSNDKQEFCFLANEYYYYDIYRREGTKDFYLEEISGRKGTVKIKISSKGTYFVIAKLKNHRNGDFVESEKSNYLEFD